MARGAYHPHFLLISVGCPDMWYLQQLICQVRFLGIAKAGNTFEKLGTSVAYINVVSNNLIELHVLKLY